MYMYTTVMQNSQYKFGNWKCKFPVSFIFSLTVLNTVTRGIFSASCYGITSQQHAF